MTHPKRPATDPAAAPDTSTPAPAATTARPASGNNANWDQDEEPWRHLPVAPKDEGPLESLGRSVSEAVTGSAGKPAGPKA